MRSDSQLDGMTRTLFRCSAVEPTPYDFTIELPAEIRLEPPPPTRSSAGEGLFSLLATFSDPRSRSVVDVDVAFLEREIDAVDVTCLDLRRRGCRVLERRDGGSTWQQNARLLAEANTEAGPQILPIRVVTDGRRVFRIAGRIAADAPETHLRTLFRTVGTFALPSPPSGSTIEPLVSTALAPHLAIVASHPESFHVTKELQMSQGHGVQLEHEWQGVPAGSLIVTAAPADSGVSEGQLFRALARYAESQGVRMSGSPVLRAEPFAGLTDAKYFAPMAWKDSARCELCAWAFTRDSYRVMVAVLGRSPRTSSMTCSLNRRAARIVIETTSGRPSIGDR